MSFRSIRASVYCREGQAYHALGEMARESLLDDLLTAVVALRIAGRRPERAFANFDDGELVDHVSWDLTEAQAEVSRRMSWRPS